MPCADRKQQRPDPEPELLAAWEVAIITGLHEKTVRRLAAAERFAVLVERLPGQRNALRFHRPRPGEPWFRPPGALDDVGAVP